METKQVAAAKVIPFENDEELEDSLVEVGGMYTHHTLLPLSPLSFLSLSPLSPLSLPLSSAANIVCVHMALHHSPPSFHTKYY